MLALQRAQPRLGAQARPVRGVVLRATAAGKGFGQQQPKKKVEEDGPVVPGQRDDRVRTLKFKGKKQRRQGPQSMPAQQLAQSSAFDVLSSPSEGGGVDLVEEIEFNQRLQALAAEGEERRKAVQRASATAGGILDTGRNAAAEDIYANPPPLSKTLLPQDDSSAAKEYENSAIGPGQAGLAVAAVLLGAVFLITSGGGDFAPSQRPTTQQVAAGQQLGEEQRADLERQLAEQQEQLAADSSNTEALEGAAVLSFQLGRYPAAEKLLEQLAAAKPGDAEVLRVLAEVQAAQGEWPASVASYRKAWEAGGQSSLEVLQGLAGALVADGKEVAAVEAVQAARASGGGGIGDVELQLLAGKTYAQWRGHVPDALAVYDGLIESQPDDFRAYLAKGLLLKDQGRAGDATRYFIQAKFFAKGANRKLVDQIIDSRQ